MHSGEEGTVVVTRREFIRSIAIQSVGEVTKINLNPGQLFAFPWLSGIARSFQQYHILGFAAEFVPTSGLAVSSTSAALGVVAMCFQYNVAESFGNSWPSSSLVGVLNMEGSVSSSPAAPSTCYLECDPAQGGTGNQPNRFVYTGESLSPYYSEQNFDAAQLIVRTEGAQAGTPFQAGLLYFTYEIVLKQPRPINPALVLVDWGTYAGAIKAWHALHNFVGPLTDLEMILFDEEKANLQAVFGSVVFEEYKAKQTSIARRLALDQTVTPAPLPPNIAKLIQQAEDEEKVHPVGGSGLSCLARAKSAPTDADGTTPLYDADIEDTFTHVQRARIQRMLSTAQTV